MRLIATSIILLWTTATAGYAQGRAAFEWKGAIEPTQTLEIRNIIGDIRAAAATGTDVEISVQITGTTPDPSTIRIEVAQHEGGVLVCTIYQGLTRPERCVPNESTSITLTNSDIRVIYTVKVPAGVNFAPKTVNGSINADLPASPISASTVNGNVVLTGARSADAHVVNGSILATLGDAGWTDSRELAAVNGAIDVEIPESARVSVRAASILGPVANDFGLPVQRNIVGSTFSGDINGGGPTLVLGSVTGSVHFRRPAGQ